MEADRIRCQAAAPIRCDELITHWCKSCGNLVCDKHFDTFDAICTDCQTVIREMDWNQKEGN